VIRGIFQKIGEKIKRRSGEIAILKSVNFSREIFQRARKSSESKQPCGCRKIILLKPIDINMGAAAFGKNNIYIARRLSVIS